MSPGTGRADPPAVPFLTTAHDGCERPSDVWYRGDPPHIDPAVKSNMQWAAVFEDTGAGQPLPEGHKLTERRAEVEQLILGVLLRLNHERAGGGA